MEICDCVLVRMRELTRVLNGGAESDTHTHKLLPFRFLRWKAFFFLFNETESHHLDSVHAAAFC